MRRLLLALAILLVAATPATADFPGVNGKIAYDRGYGAGEIWLTNQDGSGQHMIADGRRPSWSPDGTKIAYVSGGNGAGELAVMNADGGGQHLVDTDLGPNVSAPSWSPDGTQILVSAFGDIYAVPAAGGRSKLLDSNGSNPEWSPDGSLIAFTRDPTTIMIANADGTGLHALTANGVGSTSNPGITWSPDGKQIAFTGRSDGGIDVINADGTGLRSLVSAGSFGRTLPAWSPDGARIAFLENGDLCTAAVGGTDVARLTFTPITLPPPGDPAWQPLPPGSQPAGVAGRSVGPARNYPRETPWYPSCDRPDDNVTISSEGPSFALLGSRVMYTLVVKNEGTAPISPVYATDVLSTKVPGPRPVPTQGHCLPFRKSELPDHPWVSECDLGAFLPGDTATIHVRLRLTSPGSFTNTGLKNGVIGSQPQQERSSHVDTDVVRCTLRGTVRADRLHGSARTDVVCGLAGNDMIDVRGGGSDTVFCGPGRDTVLADASDRVASDCERVRRS